MVMGEKWMGFSVEGARKKVVWQPSSVVVTNVSPCTQEVKSPGCQMRIDVGTCPVKLGMVESPGYGCLLTIKEQN